MPDPTSLRVLPGAHRACCEPAAVAGPVLSALLADVVPKSDSLLVLGPVAAETLQILQGRARTCTVLLRSHADADAQQLTENATPALHVLAGSLAAFAAQDSRLFDTIVAVDGLERTAELGAEPVSWADAFACVAARLAPGGTLVLGVANPARLDTLVTVPAAADRTAGISGDSTAPTSLQALHAAFTDQGFVVPAVHCGFGRADDLQTLLSADALGDSGPGTALTALAQRAIERDCADRPRVLAPATLVRRLSLAGSLPAAASRWLTVVGGRGRSAYLQDGADVLWLDRAGSHLITGGGTRAVPAAVPTSTSVEHLLLQQIGTAQTEQFREIAAGLGVWIRESVASFTGDTIAFEDVYTDAGTFVRGLGLDQDSHHSSSTSSNSSTELLTRAWRHFAVRLADSEYLNPWPDTLSTGQLVSMWLEMSGVPEGASDAVGDTDDVDDDATAVSAPVEDLRSRAEHTEQALERAETLRAEMDVMAQLLADRDTSLQLREARIRRLRVQVVQQNALREEAVAKGAALSAGSTYRLARRIDQLRDARDPKKVARAALKRADGAIRAYRRMR